MMRAPRFWDNPPDAPSLRAQMLRPLGALYAAGTARRLKGGAREKMPVPVVCVGNINAGGVGKTPAVIAMIARLNSLFHTPHVVTRGYGGSAEGPLRVDPTKHRAEKVGDEPLLLAAFSDVWVSKDRVAGVRKAIEAGATAIILDDGFQHTAMVYDLSIVVVDAEVGFGNGLCIPAGPLREPVEVGLKRADAMLTVGDERAQDSFTQAYPTLAQIPRIKGALEPLQTGMDWTGLRALAFAGIGRPEKFFASLKGAGATLIQTEALGDHEVLSSALLSRLERKAQAQNAQLVTTEKDAARLPPSFRGKVITLPVRLKLTDEAALVPFLEQFPKAP